MTDKPSKPKSPWIAHSEREEYEDCITGNAEGLTLLRDAIDRALVSKKAEITIPYSDIRGIIVIERDHRDSAPHKQTWPDKFKALLSMLLVIFVLVLFYGFIRTTWGWLSGLFK